MPKTLFHYTVEMDGENLRIKSEIGDNLTPVEALVVALFRRQARMAERTLLAVVDEADGIILA
jgi:hypothetical protein